MYSSSRKKMQIGSTSQILRLIQSVLGYLFGFMLSTRAKRFICLGTLVAILILYYGSAHFILPHRHLNVVHGGHREAAFCIKNALEKWYKKMEKADAVIKHIPSDSVDHEFLPFVGNGYIGLTIDGDKSKLFLLNGSNIGVSEIPFSNLLQFHPMGETQDPDETIVLDMKNGEIHRFTTFNGDDVRYCIAVEQIIFVHRHIPSVLYQEIKIDNFRPSPVHGVFDLKVDPKWQREVVSTHNHRSGVYALTHGITNGKFGNQKLVAMASSLFQKEEKIDSKSAVKIKLYTLIHAEDFIPKKDGKAIPDSELKPFIDGKLSRMKVALQNEWSSLLAKPLQKSHVLAWNLLWDLSIHIDSADDPDTPSPLNVNITEYYLYSTSILNNITSPAVLEKRTGKCFYGAPTMHSSHFWVLPKNILSMLTLRKVWNDTLVKFGCQKLFESGVYGIQRAVVLSFPGLQYTRHHLELAVNPISLSSNVSLRHLPFSDNIIVITISINPPDGIKTVEIFRVKSKGPQLYACGSACEHVIEVSSSPSIFLAKITSPVTPILYVSRNKTELQSIKKSSFMIQAIKQIHMDDEPRFAAHHFKLSAKFWFAVVSAIVFFHVIVIKMIYAECRKDKTGKRSKGRSFIS